jgi:uncharacterized protein YbjT (DUF2867 family)
MAGSQSGVCRDCLCTGPRVTLLSRRGNWAWTVLMLALTHSVHKNLWLPIPDNWKVQKQTLQSSVIKTDDSNRKNTMAPTLLLTGATGRLGQLVAARLTASGTAWRAFARRPDAAHALGASEVVAGDFGAASQLDEAMAGIQCVILISGDDPDQHRHEIAVVNAAARAGVRRLVKLSAQSAGLSPPASFGRKHILVEKAIEQSAAKTGMAWTFVRPVFFQQSFLLFADSVRSSGKIILPGGKGACAFVDARDVADCLVRVAGQDGHAGKVYTLTGPQALSFAQAAEVIGRERGKPVGYVAPPAWLAKIVLPRASGMPRWLATEVIDLLQAIAKGAQAGLTQDVHKLLGKAPSHFDVFVKENVTAFKPLKP